MIRPLVKSGNTQKLLELASGVDAERYSWEIIFECSVQNKLEVLKEVMAVLPKNAQLKTHDWASLIAPVANGKAIDVFEFLLQDFFPSLPSRSKEGLKKYYFFAAASISEFAAENKELEEIIKVLLSLTPQEQLEKDLVSLLKGMGEYLWLLRLIQERLSQELIKDLIDLACKKKKSKSQELLVSFLKD